LVQIFELFLFKGSVNVFTPLGLNDDLIFCGAMQRIERIVCRLVRSDVYEEV